MVVETKEKKTKYFLIMFIAVNIILYLVNIGTWIMLPDTLTLNISLSIFNFVFTCLICYFNFEHLSKYILSHQFKQFSQVFTSAVLIFFILGLVNYLTFKHPSKLDFTARSKNSLTEQSVKVLGSLEEGEKLSFKILAKKNQFLFLQQLVDLYRFKYSNTNYEHIDIELRPDIVQKHDISSVPTFLISYKGKTQKVSEMSELAVTNAIKKLSRKSKSVVYYSTGHDELNLKSKTNFGGSFLASQFVKNDLELKELNLLTLKDFPSDLTSLLIWGPKNDFQKSEIELLSKLLDRKIGLVIALDPSPNKEMFPNLKEFLNNQGIMVRNDFVIDKKSHINGSDGTVPLVQKSTSSHPIVQNLNKALFFPLVSSIVPSSNLDRSKYIYHSLLETSPYPNSWGETNAKEFLDGNVSFTLGDAKGPLSLAVALEPKDKAARILVIGNSTMLQNSYSSFTNHFNFISNVVTWANFEDRLISFDQASLNEKPLFINKHQIGMSFYFTILFLPLCLLVTAIFMKRRQLV